MRSLSEKALRYWWALAARVDRPGARWLLVVPGSLWLSVAHRTPCLVYWRRGSWVHWYPGARIPHATLGRAAPPAALTANASDVFLHGYTPRSGDIVFDVGAGIGAETLLFSRLVGPSGHVVSLEAHPRTYQRLSSLCEVNRLTNVTPLQVAAADADAEVTLSDSADHLRNTILHNSDGLVVPTRRIDTIARELGITHIDLLKMNIEGAERLAVDGLDGIIDSTKHVCISCHDFLADAGGPEEMRTKTFVRDWLLARGFRVTTRSDAPDPWTRDYLYGTRRYNYPVAGR
jgi:FkbM family methyltransferase